MKIGDRVLIIGTVDEIRKDTVIIRNEGGYFGTVKSEIIKGDLIRCRDCVHYKPFDKNKPYSCSVGMDEITGDDYCSRGAKMDEVE